MLAGKWPRAADLRGDKGERDLDRRGDLELRGDLALTGERDLRGDLDLSGDLRLRGDLGGDCDLRAVREFRGSQVLTGGETREELHISVVSLDAHFSFWGDLDSCWGDGDIVFKTLFLDSTSDTRSMDLTVTPSETSDDGGVLDAISVKALSFTSLSFFTFLILCAFSVLVLFLEIDTVGLLFGVSLISSSSSRINRSRLLSPSSFSSG